MNSSKPSWIWPIIVFFTVLIWYGFVQQVVWERPFGASPGPDWLVWLVWLLAGVALPIFLIVARLIVTVDQEEVTIRWFPLKTRRVPLDDIAQCEARTYRPIAEFGGWGIRYGGPERGWAYTMSGNHAVFIRAVSGKHVWIGAKNPERLVAAINAARGASG